VRFVGAAGQHRVAQLPRCGLGLVRVAAVQAQFRTDPARFRAGQGGVYGV
jgi:hypothetical protein